MSKFIIVSAFIFYVGVTFGQGQWSITGRITSQDDPAGVPGVNILIKGTTIGTITDLEGNYLIQANMGDTLVYSFVGLKTIEVAVIKEGRMDIEMEPEDIEMEAVVVTALGLKREEKALGYVVQEVGGDDLSQAKELDIVNALSGKVSGVHITQGGGGLGGGGARIVIRGETSLAGNNDPLYIIDGMIGGANDVAPDDIESISVLKGPAAAALYGSKAGPGVIMITTKSGNNVEGTQIEFNSNLTWQTPLVLPEYQNKFGQGKSGQYSYYDGNNGGIEDDTHLNWGPAFDGKPRSQFTGLNPWVAYPDNVKNFYETGHIYSNNVSLVRSTDQGNYRFSYTNINQKGIIPNNGLTSNWLDISGEYKIMEKITFKANLKYKANHKGNKRGADPRFIPRNVDIEALKDYWVPGLEGMQVYSWRNSSGNPYYEVYEKPKEDFSKRFIANLSANYEITEAISLMGRFGSVYFNKEENERESFHSLSDPYPGRYRKHLSNNNSRNADFLLTYEKDISSNLSLKLSLGGSHNWSKHSSLTASVDGLLYPDIYTLKNRITYPDVGSNGSEWVRNSLYGFLNLGYKRAIFLDITGRNDWSSTLHRKNNSFAYPSAALSGILTEMFVLPEYIYFWKIRSSWALVGNDIKNPYFITPVKYNWVADKNEEKVYVVKADYYTDPYLKPELTNGWEIGTDLRLLNNRAGIDFTYYHSSTTNQILKYSISESVGGYKYRFINAGEISNYGMEVMLNVIPVQSQELTWDIQLNWSRDRAFIESLIDSLPNVSKTQDITDHLFIEDHVGERRGTFYGKGYERTPDGDILFSLSGDTRRGDKKVLGNYNPKWIASISNSIQYKNISFSFLFDYRYGAKFYNNTERRLILQGLAKITEYNNREGIVPNGMVEDGNGGYRKLTLFDLEVSGKLGGMSGEEYWANMKDKEIPEASVVNGTYLKLREVKISYSLPDSWLNKIFIKSATIAAVGRNLAVWSEVNHVDPETFGETKESSDFGGGSRIPGYDNSGIPSVRNYGFYINLKF